MHCGNVVMDNHRKMVANKNQFKNIFGDELNVYFDLMFGFDLDKLGQHIGVEPGYSVESIIREKYGKDALALVRHLMEERCNL